MRNAQQRGALCAHGELRNCLYQRQFVSDTRRKSCLQKNFDEVAHERYARSTAGGTSPWCRQEVPRRGGGSPCLPCVRGGGLPQARRWGCKSSGKQVQQPSRPYGTPSLTQGGHWLFTPAPSSLTAAKMLRTRKIPRCECSGGFSFRLYFISSLPRPAWQLPRKGPRSSFRDPRRGQRSRTASKPRPRPLLQAPARR